MRTGSQQVSGELESGDCLFAPHGGKVIEELIQRVPGGEVVEEVLHRNPWSHTRRSRRRELIASTTITITTVTSSTVDAAG